MPYCRRKMREAPDAGRRPSSVCKPKYALKKARAGIRLSRWELEDLSRDPGHALQYALHVVGGRWEPGEAAIMRSSCAVQYASDVLKGRWPEAEEFICSSPDLSVTYCERVLNSRWSVAEASICSDYSAGMRYVRNVARGRVELFEARIADFICGRRSVWRYCYANPSQALAEYMKLVGCRVPLFEEVFSRCGRASALYRYARGIGGRLPGELHSRMMMYSFDDRRKGWARRYVRHLERCRARAERWISDLDEDGRRELFGRFA